MKSINLALQGGGTHGAYAWGILDALLEDGRIDIEALSATSAGATNAAVLAYGMFTGGHDGARQALHDFWEKVSKAGQFYSPIKRTIFDKLLFKDSGSSFAFMAFDSFTRAFSPYQYNPLNINPLKSILEECVDFDALKQCNCVKLFISATNVRNGKPRIFSVEELSVDVILASAALPEIFKAVEIDGQHYWDGGYIGNPSLYPLFYKTKCRDVMIVHINPINRDDIPQTAAEIMNRSNEIGFNASLVHEIRALAFVKKLLKEDMLKDEYKKKYKDVLLHAIRSDDVLADLSVASKFDTDWDFLTSLRDIGRKQAQQWLKENYKHLGQKTTADIEGYLQK